MAVPRFLSLTQPGCRLCPRDCRVDRRAGEQGFCLAGPLPAIAQAGPHHGEEPPLSGRRGSGTIFLSGCNLHCRFCQNFDISSRIEGAECTAEDLARAMLRLEGRGCHNINFVTPTHHADVLAEAIELSRAGGLSVPVVYNCGGYESTEALRLLEGLVDIYMPDVKFFDVEASREYLNAPDYPERVREALAVMQAQVGDLAIEEGLAVRGMLIRHLVMPGFRHDATAILEFIHDRISPRAYVNVMGQYWPPPGAAGCTRIDRSVDFREVEEIRLHARGLGLRLG